LPTLTTKRREGKVLIGGKDHLRHVATERTGASRPKIYEMSLGSPVDYQCIESSVIVPVTKELLQIAESEGAPFRPFVRATRTARALLAIREEFKTAKVIRAFADDDLSTRDTSLYPAGHTATPSTKWDQANSDPFGDIRKAREKVYKATGVEANTIILPYEVALVLLDHAQYLDRRPGAEDLTQIGTIVSPLRGLNVLIAGAPFFNGTNLSSIWGDDVWVGIVDPAPVAEEAFGFGVTVVYDGPGSTVEGVKIQEMVPQDTGRGWEVVATTGEWDKVKLVPEAGYLIYDVLT
ncbi:MAG: hypothetical protein QXI19_15160, partial [Candidatus Caldarchaeum sp.]